MNIHSGMYRTLRRSPSPIKKLQQCTVHSLCPLPQPAKLPKRTIFIGANKSDLRLVTNDDQFGKYYALSHCWGDVQPLVTTRLSVNSFLTNLPWHLMPPLFQDVIEFTRSMGIHHLWIDSLCIIQDDKYDWAVESSSMAEIYSNALLTIAAIAS